MELNISELDEINTTYDNIPENEQPIKFVKKQVHFEENIQPMLKPMSKVHARRVRPIAVAPKPKVTYEDILSNMGMFVANGKLHLVDNNNNNNNNASAKQAEIPQNSYIYNKYFKEEIYQEDANRPLTAKEYQNMLVNNILQQKLMKLRQTNHRKLVMPNSNINIAHGIISENFNKLFNFSKR